MGSCRGRWSRPGARWLYLKQELGRAGHRGARRLPARPAAEGREARFRGRPARRSDPMSLDAFTFEALFHVPGVRHAISTRAGGVSTDRCASLNVSYTVGDAPANVDENLRRLAAQVGTTSANLFAAYQVHGREVTVVDDTTAARPRCDVLVTQSTARTLLLRYADCTPVLIVDPVKRAVGVAHAGWRGSAVPGGGGRGRRPAGLLRPHTGRPAGRHRPGQSVPCCTRSGETSSKRSPIAPNCSMVITWTCGPPTVRHWLRPRIPDAHIESAGTAPAASPTCSSPTARMAVSPPVGSRRSSA